MLASATHRGRSNVRGFTLLELFIAVGLVAILAAIAIPAYQRYILRAQIARARVDIATMAGVIAKSYNGGNSYPASLADVHLDTKLDPWGRPYRYYNILANGKGHARKDHALNPLNRDFDLYSVGPDGKSKSQITQKDSLDDVIRANDGVFIGVAADF
jgi:general secretion pathway protein G